MTNLILLGGPSLIDLHVWQRLPREGPVHPLPGRRLRRRRHLGEDGRGRRVRPLAPRPVVPAAAAVAAPELPVVAVLEVLPDVDHVEAVERGEVWVGARLLEDALGGAATGASAEHGAGLAGVDEAARLARRFVGGDWKRDPNWIQSIFTIRPILR